MNKTLFRAVLFNALIAVTIINFINAQENTEPTLQTFGYIRAWHQTDLSTNQGQFLVKMARMGLKGKVNQYASYRVFVDFTRLGSMNTKSEDVNGTEVVTDVSAKFSDVLLDAEAVLTPVKNFAVEVGQFKVPFSTDNLRGGADIDFVNRPLITNVAPGLRDIGIMCSYNFKDNLPLELKAGVFNGAGQNKAENDKSSNYSLRAVVSPVKSVGLSANYYGGKSSGADLGIFDLGADYKIGNVFVSGEFGQRQTKTSAQKVKSNAYFIYATYDLEFEECMITHLFPAVRYENYDQNQSLDDNEVSRVTAGLSFNFAKIKAAQFRINYELYDYKDGRKNPDKIIFELQTKF